MKYWGILLLAALFVAVRFTFAQTQDSIILTAVDVTALQADGELKSIAGSISVLTKADLEKHDGMLISNQLNSLPGVYMHNGTYNTNRIVIRGIGSRTPYGSNRIRAYLNDIPLTNGDGVTTLEDIEVAQIGRVQVMKGPNSALYGSGLGGTIKLSTQEPEKKIAAAYRYGSFNTHKTNLNGGFKHAKGAVGVSVNHTTSDGYRQNNSYLKNGVLLTANHGSSKTKLSYTLLYNQINAQIPSSVDFETFQQSPEKAAANWLSVAGYEKNARVLGGITVQHRLNQKWSNKSTIFAGHTNAYEKRPFGDLDEQSSNYGARSQFRFQQGKIGAVAGIELFSERYRWRTFVLGNNQQTIADIDENRSFSNVFVLVNYEPSRRFQLSAGGNLNRLVYQYRGSLNETGQYSYPFIFSPRLGANFALNSNVNLFASLGHGFSHPSLEETLLPDGEKNPDLQAEQGYMYESGLRFTGFENRLFIDAVFYYIALSNMLVTKRITEEVFTGVNAGKTAHSGFELQVSYDVFNRNNFPGYLGFKSSLSLSQHRFIDFIDDGNNYSGNLLPGIPAQNIYVGLNWQPINPLLIDIHYRFAGKQFLNDANSGSTKAYQLTDLKLSYQKSFGKVSFKVSGGINNLFNIGYASMLLVNAPSFGNAAPRYYYPGMPRHFYLGLGVGW